MTSDEGDKKKKEERKTAGDIIHDFWESSTLQGLPRVFTSHATFWRLFWLLMFVILLCGCAYQMYSIFDKFYERETSTSVSLAYGDVEFPSVTLCNKNPIRESQLLQHADPSLVELYNEAKDALDDESRLIYELHKYMNNLTTSDIEAQGHKGEMMIFSKAFFENIGDGWSRLRKIDYSASISSTYGNCYTLNSAKLLSSSITANKPGRRDGMSLKLFAEFDEYLYDRSESTGFILDIHRFNTTDHVDSVGIDVPTGFMTTMQIRQVRINRLEAPYGECDEEYSRSYENLYNITYTVQACNNSCESYQVAEACGCYKARDMKFYTPEQVQTLPECNLTEGGADQTCIDDVINEIYWEKTKKCSCPLPCHEVTFDVDVTYAPLTDHVIWKSFRWYFCRYMNSTDPDSPCMIAKTLPKSERAAYVRNNLAKVLIYFRELTYQSYTEQITYERSQFISDFGGNLGLWLGASIFTVLEIVELVTKITYTSASNKKNKQRGRGNPHNTDNDVIHPDEQGIPLKNTADA